MRIVCRVRNDIVGCGNQLINLLFAETENVNQMFQWFTPIQLSSEGLSRKASSRATSQGWI